MARRIRSIEYNGNVYFTSDFGIRKLESPTSLYGPSGQPRGLDVTLSLAAAVNGILPAGHWFAYRMLWGIRDINNNIVNGAPSSRAIIQNTAISAQNVQVNFLIPAYITTSHYFQIYRTKESSTFDPGDEMYLVYEGNPTAADILAGNITITDIRPDTIVGEPLYTNATQQTISQANYQPPMARDIALFRDYAFFSYITEKQRRTIELIGLNGFVSGTSKITIGGIDYIFIACADPRVTTSPSGEDSITGKFVYYTNNAISIAERIRGTAESLCRVINRYSANAQYYSFYGSAPDETPGIIEIEERRIGHAAYAFTVNSSATGLNFEPKRPVSCTSIITDNNERPNGLAFSKFQLPEAVPLVNEVNVGAKSEKIQRILALRDSLIIIKEKTIWRLTGTSSYNFTVTLLDNTISVGDRFDSAALLNNTIYALSNQGPVAISDTGVQLFGRPEEFNLTFGTLNGDGFSVGWGHEPLRIYVVSTFDQEFKQQGYAYPYSTFVYNIVTQTWTRWLINSNAFTVFNDRLYYALNNAFGYVLKQRQYAYDFYDERAAATISSINITNKSAVVFFAKSVNYDTYYSQLGFVDNFGEGWVVVDGANRYVVDSWDPMTNTATFNNIAGLTNGAKDCYRPIPWKIACMPLVGDDPSTIKEFSALMLAGSINDSYKIKVEFANEGDDKKYFFYYKYLSQLPSQVVYCNDISSINGNTPATRFRRIKLVIPKERNDGGQLIFVISNNVAGARIALKSVTTRVRITESDRLIR